MKTSPSIRLRERFAEGLACRSAQKGLKRGYFFILASRSITLCRGFKCREVGYHFGERRGVVRTQLACGHDESIAAIRRFRERLHFKGVITLSCSELGGSDRRLPPVHRRSAKARGAFGSM
jgi:hypothetical protein